MGYIPQKICILKFVCEQSIVTIEDVSQSQNIKPSVARVTLHQLGIAHTKYGDIKHGIWYINRPELFDLLRSYFPDLPTFKVRPLLLHQVVHSLTMNRIRITLEQTHHLTVAQWWSENYIRSLPSPIGRRIAHTKIPDAIFWRRRTDGSQQKFFLEYERTLKNKSRYECILQAYTKCPDVSHRNVLYICENTFIKEELEHIEKKLAQTGKIPGAGLYFQFVTLENFFNTYGHHKKEERQNDSNTNPIQLARV